MVSVSPSLAQAGLPELLPDLVGIGSAIVLMLILVALTAFVYKSVNGGIEWPEDREEDEDALREGGADDEWDYY